MLYRKYITIIYFFFLALFVEAQLFDEYADWADRNFSAQNTGLTALPILLIPAGGDYEGMGTATTGLARDASYIESNPAMSSRLMFTELSVFHKDWIADSSIESLVYTTRIEDFGFGGFFKFFHVPFTEYDRYGLQQATVRYTETIAGLNFSYNFFDSFSFDGVSVGISPKAGLARIPPELYSGVGNQNTTALMTDIGIATSFNLFKYYSSRESNTHVGISVQNIGMTNQSEPLPSRAKAGFGYYITRWALVSSDIIIPFTLDDTPNEPIGWAVGSAFDVTNFLTLTQGFYIQGGNPRFSLGSSIDFDTVSLNMTYTLDLTTQAAPDKFGIGASFSLGDRGRIERRDTVEKLYLDSLETFANGSLEQTKQLLERIITMDGEFTPAKKLLEVVEEQQRLEQEMMNIRLGEIDIGGNNEDF